MERDRRVEEQLGRACYIGNMAHLVVKVIERCENATENAQLGKAQQRHLLAR